MSRIDTGITPSFYETYSDRMWFDGSNKDQHISLDVGSNASGYFGACEISADFWMESLTAETVNQVIWSHGSQGYRAISLNGALNINATDVGFTIVPKTLYRIVCTFGATGNITDVVINGSSVYSGVGSVGNPGAGTTFELGTRDAGLAFYGSIWNLRVKDSSVRNLHWNGNGKEDWAWVDTTGGGSDGTVTGTGPIKTVGEYYLTA